MACVERWGRGRIKGWDEGEPGRGEGMTRRGHKLMGWTVYDNILACIYKKLGFDGPLRGACVWGRK